MLNWIKRFFAGKPEKSHLYVTGGTLNTTGSPIINKLHNQPSNQQPMIYFDASQKTMHDALGIDHDKFHAKIAQALNDFTDKIVADEDGKYGNFEMLEYVFSVCDSVQEQAMALIAYENMNDTVKLVAGLKNMKRDIEIRDLLK